MKTGINENLKMINEAGIKTELAFDNLKKQLGCMIEAAVRWLSEADLQKRLLEAGVIDAGEYEKRIASLRIGPGEGSSAPFDEVYNDAKICIERCTAAIKDLDRIREQLDSDPHPHTTSDDTNFGL